MTRRGVGVKTNGQMAGKRDQEAVGVSANRQVTQKRDDPARNRDKRLHDELKQERTRERAHAR